MELVRKNILILKQLHDLNAPKTVIKKKSTSIQGTSSNIHHKVLPKLHNAYTLILIFIHNHCKPSMCHAFHYE